MCVSQKALQACQVRQMAQMSCVPVMELLRWQYPLKKKQPLKQLFVPVLSCETFLLRR